MSKMIAFCGLCCMECPTYLATKKDDDDARKKRLKCMPKNLDLI